MIRQNAYHILALVLACLGAAAWTNALNLGGDAERWGAVALWLTSAGCATLHARAARRERAAIVVQLRQAAADIRPDDGRRAAPGVDAGSFGAAVDGLIAAGRAQAMASASRVRELELALKAAALERDHAQAAVAELAAHVRAAATAVPAAPAGPPRAGPGGRFAKARLRRSAAVRREVANFQRGLVTLVSHQLRTPLASIKAYTEMLIDGEAADARSQREFFDVIHAEADRLGRSIDNVLTLARLDAGLVTPAPRAVSLARVAAAAAEAHAARAAAKGVELVVGCDLTDAAAGGAHADTAWADRDLLAPVVANLIDNAVRYTPGGGRVTVRPVPAASPDAAALQIADTGSGFDPKGLPESIDTGDIAGDRSDAARSPGLGLAVARRVVGQVLGGRLDVESIPGQGTRVTIELPRPAATTTNTTNTTTTTTTTTTTAASECPQEVTP